MTRLFVDIETIGAQEASIKAHVASLVKPPAQMKKAETIAAWEKEQKAEAVAEAVAKTALNGAYGHICCIGFAIDDGPATAISWPLNATNEALAIDGFFKTAGEALGNRFPVIVGHNVADFDIRFLVQRSMVLGVKIPAWFPINPKPWGGEVFDTMTAFAGGRDTISMDNLCIALGLPGKVDIDGSMVGQLWANDEFETISAYCIADVERTRAIHRKMAFALGEAA